MLWPLGIYTSDPVDKAIKKLRILSKHFTYQKQNLFCFNEVTKSEVLKEISHYNNEKATAKILNVSSKLSDDTITSLVNKPLTSSRKFPSNVKLAGIALFYKKKILNPKKTIEQPVFFM